MAYDEDLAERVRGLTSGLDAYSERRMFGGLCFMLNRNMFAGVVRDDLMLRRGKEAAAEALALPATKPMDFTGRVMPGMVFVEPEGCATSESLSNWVNDALTFVQALPPKTPDTKKPRRTKHLAR